MKKVEKTSKNVKNAKKACFRVHPPFRTFGPDIKTPKNPIWPELKCPKKVHSRPIRPILREPPFEGFGRFLMNYWSYLRLLNINTLLDSLLLHPKTLFIFESVK